MTEETEQKMIMELKKMKKYFPFRIVFAVMLEDNTFEVYAKTTKHLMNKFVKEGKQVFTI